MEIRVNLLPEHKREELEKAKRLRILMFLEVSIIVIGFVFFTSLFFYDKILSISIASMDEQSESKTDAGDFKRMKQLDDEFKAINTRMAEIFEMEKDQMCWSNLLLKLSQIVPEKIMLTDFSTKNYKVFIVGVADDRDSLIAFKDRLTQENCFEEVNLPLSNLVSKDNISFQIDLNIKRDCLKKK